MRRSKYPVMPQKSPCGRTILDEAGILVTLSVRIRVHLPVSSPCLNAMPLHKSNRRDLPRQPRLPVPLPCLPFDARYTNSLISPSTPHPLPSVFRNNMPPQQCCYTHYTHYTRYFRYTAPALMNSQGPLPSVAAPLASHFYHFIPLVLYSRTCRLGESSPLAAASPRRTRVLRRTRRTASLRPRRYTERTPRWQVCRIPHRISAELRFWRAPESTSPALLLLVPPPPSS